MLSQWIMLQYVLYKYMQLYLDLFTVLIASHLALMGYYFLGLFDTSICKRGYNL